ncbi:MAG: TetR/AcrR family transcriptional regulator [Candidatus Actinomarina sp.]|jgi:AcrR family transcriptional regulator|uniref:MedDCM-OCT-S24-C97-cds5 n=1 Tax=Candidatus Actinomarina minuta TaxID=1389454 RepID=S5DPG1_9ACTN|nr:MedDCM-OCT-S24-C97-cds5 [Candidatus Actinomarina minuta]
MTELQDGRAARQQTIYDENKMKLIETALDVINEIGDINEVTLSTIAKAAGVSPATAYNHFPDRMTDLFSSIVKLKLDVRETIMSMTTESKLIDTIKQIPYIYAKQMVDLGYTGQVLVSQMGHLQANDKWLEDDPVVVLTTLLTEEGTYKKDAQEIAEKITTTFRGAMFEYSLHRDKLENQYTAYTPDVFLQKCSLIVEDILKQY